MKVFNILFRYVVVPLVVLVIAVYLFWEAASRYPGFVIGAVVLVCIAAWIQGWRKEKNDKKRSWRVGHVGRDSMYYEELSEGAWRRMEIDGEMLCGKAHHVIYFKSLIFPEWASGRRSEIMGRIKSQFQPPGYEYDEG